MNLCELMQYELIRKEAHIFFVSNEKSETFLIIA